FPKTPPHACHHLESSGNYLPSLHDALPIWHRLVTTVSQQPSSIRGQLRRDVVDNRVADAVRAGGISAFHRAECDRNRAERLSGLQRAGELVLEVGGAMEAEHPALRRLGQVDMPWPARLELPGDCPLRCGDQRSRKVLAAGPR